MRIDAGVRHGHDYILTLGDSVCFGRLEKPQVPLVASDAICVRRESWQNDGCGHGERR
ncbi:hypothetical protein Misp04_50160 [Micromonospora sp. NBRC 101691]|nr:hypothetical protein Misp04_50160 [Micromonospora sp. NBRC 101691]